MSKVMAMRDGEASVLIESPVQGGASHKLKFVTMDLDDPEILYLTLREIHLLKHVLEGYLEGLNYEWTPRRGELT